MSRNCELGRGLRTREKNATEGGAGRFEKTTPDARAAPPEAHESLIGRKTVEEVSLTGLSFSDGPTPGQRLADTIESIAEPPLTVLSFFSRRNAGGDSRPRSRPR